MQIIYTHTYICIHMCVLNYKLNQFGYLSYSVYIWVCHISIRCRFVFTVFYFILHVPCCTMSTDISVQHRDFHMCAYVMHLSIKLTFHPFTELLWVCTVETLYSTIYYSKYFIELNNDKSTQYVAL